MSVRGTERNAVLYSQVNEFQQQYGKALALTAGIKPGDKILDMGCGTGELTVILAKMVDKETPLVGVDPDVERIKLATQKHSSDHQNITFIPRDSSSQFPHFDKQYYDVYFSNLVFQWLNTKEKEKFVNTAFRVLKPGGKLAILSHEGDNAAIMEQVIEYYDKTKATMTKTPLYYVSKATTEALLQKAGFSLLHSEYFHYPYTFDSGEAFLAWFYGSDYYDTSFTSQTKKAELIKRIVNKDGSVTFFDPTIYQIVAEKPEYLSL